ncbi:MAG: ATP-binding protein [Rikenellaceae bacterium]
MKSVINPFITSGYISAEYFCDREKESKSLINEIINGNNVALISTRRMGKTGLIQHCFHNKEIKNNYYTFFVDIYASKSLRDFVLSLSKVVLEGLKPFGRKAIECFVNSMSSLQAGITFDIAGNPSFNVQLGDIHDSATTLEEIFKYLNKADKPCIVAIDEFQQIMFYQESGIEALLRTHIQHCNNAHFIFAGSRHHTMGNIFSSTSRPFYQSVSIMNLESIDLAKYVQFVVGHFNNSQKEITTEAIEKIYHRFHGVTWYMQKIMNILYSTTPVGDICEISSVDEAITNIVESYRFTYEETLFRLPEKQKEMLIAISKEDKAMAITSSEFVKKYSFTSASSVQSAMKGLLEKDFVTYQQGVYRIYDQFFGIWLQNN